MESIRKRVWSVLAPVVTMGEVLLVAVTLVLVTISKQHQQETLYEYNTGWTGD